MKKFGVEKWQLFELGQFLQHVFNRGYARATIMHTRADQLLLQLLMDQFDTLP